MTTAPESARSERMPNYIVDAAKAVAEMRAWAELEPTAEGARSGAVARAFIRGADALERAVAGWADADVKASALKSALDKAPHEDACRSWTVEIDTTTLQACTFRCNCWKSKA